MRAGMSLQPFTRRKLRSALSMPAANHRLIILPSRQRFTLAKVPVQHQAEVKAAFWTIFDDIDAPSGDAAVALARDRAVAFERRYGAKFPAAVECLMADFASLSTHLRFPSGHRSRIRHSNFIWVNRPEEAPLRSAA